MCLTVGGNKLDYLHDATSPAASLIETKMLLNSVISDSSKGARFFTLDIKDFFLQTHIQDHEYMCIHKKYFSNKLQTTYNLHNKLTSDNYVNCRIKKGMYGLKQAACLAYDDLVHHLQQFGYSPDKNCSNIWSHKTRKTKFFLCVDDFGVKCFNQSDKDHIIHALQ